ncbi:MAG: DUF4255 domain-containing protein [Pseudomonadota bacterium]
MSGTDAIWRASTLLRQRIGAAVEGGDGSIQLSPPNTENDQAGADFSLWLYRLIENEHQKNVPSQRVGEARLRPTPLVLDLYYLLTPLGANEETRQLRLGEAMRAIHAAPIIRSDPPDAAEREAEDDGRLGFREELHVQLFRLGLEELTRIWESLSQPLRLSVVYQVRFIRLDLPASAAPAPVTDRRVGSTAETEGAL